MDVDIRCAEVEVWDSAVVDLEDDVQVPGAGTLWQREHSIETFATKVSGLRVPEQNVSEGDERT